MDSFRISYGWCSFHTNCWGAVRYLRKEKNDTNYNVNLSCWDHSRGISSSITFLELARIIQGIGISIFPIALGMIKNQLPNDKVAIGVGIFSSMFAAGSVIGLAVGSNIVENFDWRTTFSQHFLS